jgi:RNA methyltransferase, TrmH family
LDPWPLIISSLSQISSRRHPLVQACRALASGRGDDGEILLDGPHVVAEALKAGVELVAVLHDDREAGLGRQAAGAGADTHHVTASVLEAASPVRQPSGIVAIARWKPTPAVDLVASTSGPIVALVDVQDPGNVGGIIRSADALGAAAVLALDSTANPGGWKALRAAMGSTFRIPVGTGMSDAVLHACRDEKVQIVCANVRNGVIAYEWSPPERFVLLVGNEGSGLPQPVVAWADVHVTIPMRPGIDSLNVGIGTALLLSEVARRRRGKR